MGDAPQKKEKGAWWKPGLFLFYRLSGWIAGPVVAAVFLGRWLDNKYKTEPWLFLLSVGVAFFISSFGIVRDTMKEMRRIEKEDKKSSKSQISNHK